MSLPITLTLLSFQFTFYLRYCVHGKATARTPPEIQLVEDSIYHEANKEEWTSDENQL